MYQIIKNVLFNPRSLQSFGKTKGWKVLVYFLVLVVIFALPDMINIIQINKVDYSTIADFQEAFSEQEIPFIIEDNVLKGTEEDVKGKLIHLPVYGVDLNFGSEIQDEGKEYLIVVLEEEKIVLTTRLNPKVTFDIATYEELNINQLDFRDAISSKNEAFWNKFTLVLNQLYNKYNVVIIALGLPFVTLSLGIALLLIITFTAFLVNLLNKRMGSTFRVVYKITIVAYTPYVIGSILAIFFYLNFLNNVGSLLAVVYALIRVNEYYKGQITNPNQ